MYCETSFRRDQINPQISNAKLFSNVFVQIRHVGSQSFGFWPSAKAA
jgi:hypothetical protein